MRTIYILSLGAVICLSACSSGENNQNSNFSSNEFNSALNYFSAEEIQIILDHLDLTHPSQLSDYVSTHLQMSSTDEMTQRQLIISFLRSILEEALLTFPGLPTPHTPTTICSDEIPNIEPNKRTVPSGFQLISISNAVEFLEKLSANTASQYFRLTRDIDFAGITFTPINNFYGILDGNGYTLKNIIYTEENSGNSFSVVSNVGIFRKLHGIVIDLHLEDITIHGPFANRVGALAGWVQAPAKIEKVFLSGNSSVSAKHISGGLVGLLVAGWNTSLQRDAQILSSKIIDAVISGDSAGGVAGSILTNSNVDDQAIISHSYAKASIQGETSAGGLVANLFQGGVILQSCAESDVKTQKRFPSHITWAGGLVGKSRGIEMGSQTLPPSIIRSFSRSTVLAQDWAGGLVGQLGAYSFVEDTFSAGYLQSVPYEGNEVQSYMGGFVGSMYVWSYETHSSLHINNSFSRSLILNADNTRHGGFVGKIEINNNNTDLDFSGLLWLKDQENGSLRASAVSNAYTSNFHGETRAALKTPDTFRQHGYTQSVWSLRTDSYPSLIFE